MFHNSYRCASPGKWPTMQEQRNEREGGKIEKEREVVKERKERREGNDQKVGRMETV